MRTAMMVTTASTSINVKADRFLVGIGFFDKILGITA